MKDPLLSAAKANTVRLNANHANWLGDKVDSNSNVLVQSEGSRSGWKSFSALPTSSSAITKTNLTASSASSLVTISKGILPSNNEGLSTSASSGSGGSLTLPLSAFRKASPGQLPAIGYTPLALKRASSVTNDRKLGNSSSNSTVRSVNKIVATWVKGFWRAIFGFGQGNKTSDLSDRGRDSIASTAVEDNPEKTNLKPSDDSQTEFFPGEAEDLYMEELRDLYGDGYLDLIETYGDLPYDDSSQIVDSYGYEEVDEDWDYYSNYQGVDGEEEGAFGLGGEAYEDNDSPANGPPRKVTKPNFNVGSGLLVDKGEKKVTRSDAESKRNSSEDSNRKDEGDRMVKDGVGVGIENGIGESVRSQRYRRWLQRQSEDEFFFLRDSEGRVQSLYRLAMVWLSGRRDVTFFEDMTSFSSQRKDDSTINKKRNDGPNKYSRMTTETTSLEEWTKGVSEKATAALWLALWLSDDLAGSVPGDGDNDEPWAFRYPAMLGQPIHIALAVQAQEQSGGLVLPEFLAINDTMLRMATGGKGLGELLSPATQSCQMTHDNGEMLLKY